MNIRIIIDCTAAPGTDADMLAQRVYLHLIAITGDEVDLFSDVESWDDYQGRAE